MQNFKQPINTSEAVSLLSRNEVVALPTETVYGLAGSINSEEALKNIFSIKERPFFDPLIVHISSLEELKSYVSYYPEEIVHKLSKAFWPGPLTLVLPKSDKVNDIITSGLDTVALRIPNHPKFLEIIKAVGPLAAPSANKFGKTSPTSSRHIIKEFEDSVPVVDGGDCEVGIESTILQITKSNELNILRPGQVTAAQIADVLGLDVGAIKKTYEGSVAPGQLKYHYQPNKPLALVNRSFNKEDTIAKVNDESIKTAEVIELSLDPQIFARQMYAAFREYSKKETDLLILPIDKQSSEDWDAINNRLKKASTWDFRI